MISKTGFLVKLNSFPKKISSFRSDENQKKSNLSFTLFFLTNFKLTVRLDPKLSCTRYALAIELHPAFKWLPTEYRQTGLSVASSEVILLRISVSTLRFVPLEMATLLVFS